MQPFLSAVLRTVVANDTQWSDGEVECLLKIWAKYGKYTKQLDWNWIKLRDLWGNLQLFSQMISETFNALGMLMMMSSHACVTLQCNDICTIGNRARA